MKKTEVGREYHEYPHGSQVIATRIAYFNHAPDTISQHPGDMMMVNHDRWEDGPAGTSTKGIHKGLGSSMKRHSCRLATMEDDGYLATKEEWAKFYGLDNRPKPSCSSGDSLLLFFLSNYFSFA